MENLNYLYYFLIMPGFLFSLALGLILSWIDRKVTARVQWRQGPPFYQPLADVLKLLGKETIIPEGAPRLVFLGAPLLGMTAVILVSTLLWLTNLDHHQGFIGDVIVELYLLVIPSLAIILGGSASRNALAALGSSREMKLILSYELPFTLAVFTAVLKSGSINFPDLMANPIAFTSLSGTIAFLVSLLVVQAKLAYVPFDIPEAEQEIAAGPLIEYSGPPLAIYKMTRALLLSVLPLFLITVFWGGLDLSSLSGFLWFALKYVIIITLIVLIKNTNPRVRIDQALRFFWGPMTIVALIGFILAVFKW